MSNPLFGVLASIVVDKLQKINPKDIESAITNFAKDITNDIRDMKSSMDSTPKQSDEPIAALSWDCEMKRIKLQEQFNTYSDLVNPELLHDLGKTTADLWDLEKMRYTVKSIQTQWHLYSKGAYDYYMLNKQS